MPNTAPLTVYHYCSLEALHGIVSSRKLWMTNVLFVNDYLEVEWFKDICREVADENLRALDASPYAKGCTTIAEPVLHMTSGVPPLNDAVFAKRRYLDDLKVWLSKKEFDRIFCACFSKVPDDLSQWRGYADEARGMCLGVNLDTILAANTAWPRLESNEVIYDVDQQRDTARRIVSNDLSKVSNHIGHAMSKAGLTHATLRLWSPRFKNPAFKSEDEVRLLVHDSITGTNLDKSRYDEIVEQQFPSGIKFRARGGALIPYVEIDFPLDAISELWLGPRFGDGLAEAGLRLFLNKHGIDFGLRRSKASYRQTQ